MLDNAKKNTGASASATYTMTLYPTNAVINEFRSKSPMAVSLAFAGVIVFCVVV